jgi:valyl-tRNA synthetase
LNTQDIKEKLIKTPIPKTLADRWILSRLHSTISLVTKQIEDLEFGKAERVLYDFIWKELADVYLEMSKFQLKDEKLKKQTQKILLYLLANILKLLHPFCPFVTEKIWIEKFGDLRRKNLLIITEWPKAQRKFLNKAAEKRIQEIKNHLKRLQKTNLQQTKIQP